MRFLIFLFLIIFSAQANEVKIEIVPKKPVAGESFNAIFRIATTSDNDPIISFDPQNLEVQGRESRGVSIRTKFINGKLFTEKEVSYSYELIAPSQTTAYLKNIKVRLDKDEITHPNVKIKIFRTPQKSKDFFARAQIDKTNVYVGEGVTVKYYLYHKSQVRNFEITAYPKLGKFLKRFYNKPENRRNVEIDGEVYRQTLLYSARVFAERPGQYYVDPVKLKVEYIIRDRNDPFGSFGLGLQRLRSKRIQSDRVEISVKELPPAPANIKFSGLVGKHTFKVFQPKNRFLVNEAIEVKLEVSGGGALEAVEAPVLYQDGDLEEFETNSDLTVMGDTVARKTYEYTYLARNSLSIDQRKMKIYYFDPIRDIYDFEEISLPGIQVLGGNIATSSSNTTSSEPTKSSNIIVPTYQSEGTQVVGPIFKDSFFSKYRVVNIVNYSLAGIILVILISFFTKKKAGGGTRDKGLGLVKKMKSGEADYSTIFQFLKLEEAALNTDLKQYIKSKNLSKDSEKYLIELLESAQSSSYYMGERIVTFKYKKKPFQDFLNNLET